MGKIKVALVAALLLTFAPAANAATPTLPTVTGVSATWVTAEGFVVDWAPVANARALGVTSFVVTASNGQTCSVGNSSTECVFSSSKVPFGFKPYLPYTFTVAAKSATATGPSSAPSNAAGWYGAPGYPSFIVSKTKSDNQIDVKWVPSSSTGGVTLTGYKVFYWPLNRDNEQKMIPSLDNSVSLTGLKKSTWYVIAIQSCNYYGCSTSDWAFQATTPAAASTSTSLLPRMLSGGNASTTCWDAVVDGGAPTSTSMTVTKAPAGCPAPVAPSTWPAVDPNATKSPNLPIATKFDPKTWFSLANASYSMSYKWNGTNLTTTNFTQTRSLGARTYESLTPKVCSIVTLSGGTSAWYLAPGTCTIRLSIAADETFFATSPVTASFVVRP